MVRLPNPKTAPVSSKEFLEKIAIIVACHNSSDVIDATI